MKKHFFLYLCLVSTGLFCQTSIDSDSIAGVLKNLSTEEERLSRLYTALEDYEFSKDTIYETLLNKYIPIAQKNRTHCNYALRFTNKLANYYIYDALLHKKADSLLSNFNDHIEHCTNLKEIGKFYIAHSEAKIYVQEPENSLTILKNAYTFFEQEKDSTLYEYAYSYLKAGEASISLNKLSEGAGYFKKAEELFTHQKDTLFLLWTKNGLSTLFSNNGLYDEAEKERELIYELAPKIGEEQVAAMAHIRASLDANFLNKSDEELFHIREALRSKNESSDIYGIVNTLSLAFATSVFAKNQKIDSSNFYLKKLQPIIREQQNNAFLKTYMLLAQSYNALANSRLTAAENYAVSAKKLISNNKANPNYLEVTNLLASIYEEQGNPEKSLQFYKEFNHLRDSLLKESSRKKFAYVQTLFETEKKDLQISRQEEHIALLDSENRIKMQWIIFGGLSLIGIFITFLMFRSRKHAIRQKELQEDFSKKLIQNQEKERTRVARELHDSVGQKLILLTKKTKALDEGDLTTLATTTLDELRNISRGLHPSVLEKLGLTNAITSLINQVDENTDIFFTHEIENIDTLVSQETALHLYRIIQEILNNMIKHSKAKAASITIKKNSDTIQASIKDNGKGFDYFDELKLSPSLGMKTLLERAKIIRSKINIQSQPNKGTHIYLQIPFSA